MGEKEGGFITRHPAAKVLAFVLHLAEHFIKSRAAKSVNR